MKIRIKNSSPVQKYYPNLELGDLLQTLLMQRGFSEEEVLQFLNAKKLELTSPFEIFGMQNAVEIILQAVRSKQKIVIHGDFDVDGVSASTILWDYLFYELKADCLPIIPHRVDEGYGLSEKTIQKALDYNQDSSQKVLIITVDCGIKDKVLVDKYKEQIDFVITDHHQFATNESGEIELPDAKAVVHSAHPEGNFPAMISGAATAWQVVRALQETNPIPDFNEEKYLDLVALSTVCDIIPLDLENRKLVLKGLEKLSENSRLGLQELIKLSGINPKEITSYHCGFVLGPRLNAPGRVLNDATDALRLLATRNLTQAQTLSEKLHLLNLKRKELTTHYIDEAEKAIDPTQPAIVFVGKEWPEGILGLVAGKLAEKHFKPVFIGSVDESGHIIGSSRSPLETFYLSQALEHAKDHLERYGGHKQAAGFASNKTKFEGFEQKIIEFINQNTSIEDFEKALDVDLTIGELSKLNLEEVEQLSLLEPHGPGNLRPVFLFSDLVVNNIFYLGSEKTHLKLSLLQGETKIDAIAFNFAHEFENLGIKLNDKVEVVGHLNLNVWNNTKKIQIEIKHLNLV